MRRRVIKNKSGNGKANDKEVLISITKAGLNARGEQRYTVTIRFAGDSWKKVSSSGYVAVEIDDENQSVYFVTSNEKDGFKLVSSSKNCKTITFSSGVNEWKAYDKNKYFLKKDINEGTYYIDITKGEK